MASPHPQPPLQQLNPTLQSKPPPPLPFDYDPTRMASSQDAATQPFHWNYGELDQKSFQVHGRSLLLVIVIFSLILFFTLLFLYVRWAWRDRRMVITISTSSGHAFSGGGHAARGLDRETIDGYPVTLHVGEEGQCSICLSNLAEGEKVKVLPGCDHGFHPECVDQWLRSNPTCPLCRASLLDAPPAEPLEVV